MATFDQEEQVKTELRTALNELVKLKPDDLVRADVLGKDLSFEPGKLIFERTLKLFRDLDQANLDNVAFNALTRLRNQATAALSQFKSINEFSVTKYPSNTVGQRDAFISQIRENYDACFDALAPVIAYSIRKGTDFEKIGARAGEIVHAMETTSAESQTKQRHLLVEMESTLQRVRRAAAEVGVSQHATHFKDQSDEHARLSGKWLYATAIMAVLTVAWGFVTFFIHATGTGTTGTPPVPNPPTVAEIVQFTFSKIIILSGLYYALVWCARNYSAHRHNYVVNKHRQNALSSFETFAKAAGDDADIKNAVLLQATQSIFAPQISGYTESENDATAPSKIIEILRSVGAAQKGS